MANYHKDAQAYINSAKSKGMTVKNEGSELIAYPKGTPKKTLGQHIVAGVKANLKGEIKPKPVSTLGEWGQKALNGANKIAKGVGKVVNNNTPVGVIKGVKGFLKDNKDAQNSTKIWGETQDALAKQKANMRPRITQTFKTIKAKKIK